MAQAEEQLLDIRVAEASAAYKFYLNQEKKILGGTAVILFLLTWEAIGNWLGLINPMFMSAPSLKSITTSISAVSSSFGDIFYRSFLRFPLA